MFKLAGRRGDCDGPYCGPAGLYLGPSPLIARVDGAYRRRAEDEIAALLAAAGIETDTARLLPGLDLIAGALQHGEMARAMIAAVHLRLPEIPEDGIARIARADGLLKYNFDPNQPRDWHGQWSDEGGGGNGSDAGSPGPQLASADRTWERYPNSDFRVRLAEAEQAADKPNFGYGEVNPRSGALGRYQMTPDALRAAGMADANGNWTGKYGVRSRSDFLADPDAQEQALTDFLSSLERELRAKRASAFVGRTIDGLRAQIPVTRANLLAAAHRRGASDTLAYLHRVGGNGFTSRGLRLTPEDLAVETRLRTFADAHYE